MLFDSIAAVEDAKTISCGSEPLYLYANINGRPVLDEHEDRFTNKRI